jgi:hypothetical protein
VSTVPSRVLPCDCQERFTVSHFHQAQFNQLRYVSLVDYVSMSVLQQYPSASI